MNTQPPPIHPEMMRFYQDSPDIRVICVTDPVVRACFETGKSPMETIIILADRNAAILKEVKRLHEHGPAPIIICKRDDK